MARATASVPITASAPGRSSITIAGPCARPICSASWRARVSPTPPAANGTTTLMILDVCDHAEWPDRLTKVTATAASAAATDGRRGNRQAKFMTFALYGGGFCGTTLPACCTRREGLCPSTLKSARGTDFQLLHRAKSRRDPGTADM